MEPLEKLVLTLRKFHSEPLVISGLARSESKGGNGLGILIEIVWNIIWHPRMSPTWPAFDDTIDVFLGLLRERYLATAQLREKYATACLQHILKNDDSASLAFSLL